MIESLLQVATTKDVVFESMPEPAGGCRECIWEPARTLKSLGRRWLRERAFSQVLQSRLAVNDKG